MVRRLGRRCRVGRLIGFVAALLLSVAALGQPVLAQSAAPADPSGLVAPSAVRVASSGIDAAPMSTVRTIGRGEKVTDLVNEAKALTFTTGNEHAVVKLASGDRVLISGGPGGIDLTTDVTLVYGHTHPYGVLSNGPSPGDYAMLDALDQPFSYVIDNGEVIRFNRGGG